MSSTANIDQFVSVPDNLTKAAYQAFQQGKGLFGLAHKVISSQITNLVAPEFQEKVQLLPPETLLTIQQRLEKLLEADWLDAEKGIYPASLLFDNPWEDFFRYYPAVWLDMPLIWGRLRQKQYQTFASSIEREGYPSYYLQNFHHQTDGYLSDMSANLYDLQVEILFNGTADAMRRRVLAPLKTGLESFADTPPRQQRILDVACGTGRTLKMIRAAFPKASLFGADLSPAYLRKANQMLSENPGDLPQLLQANAEELPYTDSTFHGTTCVFLFHELPPLARQRVIDECFRITKPGGVFIICDSIQKLDYPEFETMMDNFPTMFHEPYYRHYVTDNLSDRLTQAGFENIQTENHFMSKYWIAHKPL